MSKTIEVDGQSFWEKLSRLYNSWKSSEESWSGVDAITLSNGVSDGTDLYSKSVSLQTWFFGYEFPDTIIILCANKAYILCSAKKAAILKPVTNQKEGRPVDLEILESSKEGNSAHFKTLLEAIRTSNSGKAVGVIKKDKPKGAFIEPWLKELEQFEQKDVASNISDVFAVKDQKELKAIRTAAVISSHILKQILVPKIETVIDEEQKVTHKQLAEVTEAVFEDPAQISAKLNSTFVDSCYSPIIQSGGEYDPRPGIPSNDNYLHFGTILVSLGARYRGYCSNVGRTYLVDPTPQQEQAYKILIETYQLVIKSLKPGESLSSVYDKALKHVQSKNPELAERFGKTCGYSMGIELSEVSYAINAKATKKIKPGMVFNIQVVFNNVRSTSKDPKKEVFSLLLADTVCIKEDGEAEILTDKCTKKYGEISYFLEGEPETKSDSNSKMEVEKKSSKQEPAKPKTQEKIKQEQPQPKVKKQRDDVILDTKLRDRKQEEKNKEKEDKRREHQRLLEERQREDAAKRFEKHENKKDGKKEPGQKVTAYKDASEFPRDVPRNKLYVDTVKEVVLVPIYGIQVPFHISTVKNASKMDEEYLRINFNVPENRLLKTDAKSQPICIKEIVYRCPDERNLNNNLRMIKELRKRWTTREAVDAARGGPDKEQEKLILSKGRNPKLADVFVRPSATGRKMVGFLEAHTNGFRFSPGKGEFIDILYKNIKHAFFQPAEKELLVLCHFSLNYPILIGKKKTSVWIDYLDGRGKYDPDEIEDEQREKQNRQRLNTEYQNFVRKVEEFVPGGLEFDIPYRDLGFYGAPFRSNVFMVPTVNCLVHLSEQPFFVITLAEVEIAYFERVQFSLRNFDLVFVFKDYNRQVVHVNTISVEYLDTIKEWLDSCNIKYYEGTQSLNWNRIMATIKEDPKKFHTEDGGWSFLSNEANDDSSSSGGESDYSGESEEASGSESEDEYSEEADDSEEAVYSSDEEEEDGEDWDELDRKAKEADKERAKVKRSRGEEYSDEEEESDKEEKPKKKKK